jgi:hypothetical protein
MPRPFLARSPGPTDREIGAVAELILLLHRRDATQEHVAIRGFSAARCDFVGGNGRGNRDRHSLKSAPTRRSIPAIAKPLARTT